VTGRADRTFHYALAASVALHAVVLFAGWHMNRELPPPGAASAPVVARLAEIRIPDAPPAVEEPKPAEAKASKPIKPRKSAQITKPAPQAPAKATEEAVAAAPRAAESAPASPAPSAAPAAAPGEHRAPEATTAAQYRLQLIGAARRYAQAYPSVARENNWNGDVVLDVLIRADGRAELSMRRGSGHEVLDRQALDTFQRALRDVPVPPSLRGRQLALEPLVVVYALKD
jgi:periplasmic protein TonB